MKTLIVYNADGKIYFTGAGDITNDDVNTVIVDVPDGKEIAAVDGATGAVTFKDRDKTDVELMGEQITAIYYKLSEGYTGTLDNPIPWVYGMECKEGLYYSYKGEVYKIAAGGYMNPCVWYPDSGIWHFEKI